MKYNSLFIVGAGRSGTTWLWRILNNSKYIHLCNEIHFFSSLYHNGFQNNYKKFIRSIEKINPDLLFKCLTQKRHFGLYWKKTHYFTEEQVKSYFADNVISKKNIYKFLLYNDLELTTKAISDIKYLGEKTPLNVFHIQNLLNWFPRAQFIFIYRNPIDVLKSEANKPNKIDYPLRKRNAAYYLGIVIFVYFEWLFAGLIATRFSQSLKNRFLIISYEKLIYNKKKTISQLCNIVDIPFYESLCSVKKIGSSYTGDKNKEYWEPNIVIKMIFKTLNSLHKKLDQISIR